MSHCPSCGRYVGPRRACPHCGARVTGRMPVRVVKLTAIALATVGLASLWFVATRTEVPTVAIGRAGATMNMAYVRVEGRCTRSPSYDPETEYLSFWLADDTGELRVVSYREETRALIAGGRVPALGDRVAVVGTLRIQDDFRSLTVNVPREVSIKRAEPEPCAIGAIVPDQSLRRVRVRGQVRQVVRPYPGLTLIALRDETGTVDVALEDDLMMLSRVTPTVKVGQSIEVAATVSQYEGRAQLVPASAADVVSLDDDVAVAARHLVMELPRQDVGAWVAVRGMLARIDRFSKGVKLTLDDGTGAVIVLLWEDVYQDLKCELAGDAGLALGADIEVQGELTEYRGDLEVVPELATDVHVRAGGTAMAVTPIGTLTSDDLGRSVVVRGTLGLPEPFSAGIKYPLRDETGTIILLLWSEVYRSIPEADRLTLGTVVEVVGEIEQYRGDLEIVATVGGVKPLE